MYESYRSFASVYDEFMDGTDYRLTADRITEMICSEDVDGIKMIPTFDDWEVI